MSRVGAAQHEPIQGMGHLDGQPATALLAMDHAATLWIARREA